MEKITVFIPSYKSEYFEESLLSVLNQTYKEFKLLILDDNPGDGIGNIVNKYISDKRITYIKNDENIGEINNTYKGVNMCNTEYIWIFHDDDIAHPSLIEKSLNILEHFPDVVTAGSNYTLIDQYGEVIETIDMYKRVYGKSNENEVLFIEKGEFIKYGYVGFLIQSATRITRTDVLKEAFKEPLAQVEFDYGIQYILNYLGTMALIEEPLVKRRCHENQGFSTAKNNFDFFKRGLGEKLDEYLKDKVRSPAERLKLKRVYGSACELYYIFSAKQNDIIFSRKIDYLLIWERMRYYAESEKLVCAEKSFLYFSRKISLLTALFPPGTNRDYVIWGAGSAGIITYKIISKFVPTLNCIGFIDKFKEGEEFGMKITNPEEYDFNKNVYVVIATSQGFHEAGYILYEKGFEMMDDYIYGYGINF